MADQYDPKFEQWKAKRNWDLESLKAIVQFATLTIRSLIIINGGAMVVLIALLGSIWGSNVAEGKVVAISLGISFTYFIWGLVTAVITSTLGYIAQVFFTERPSHGHWGQKVGVVSRILAVVMGLASIIFFILGAKASLLAFS